MYEKWTNPSHYNTWYGKVIDTEGNEIMPVDYHSNDEMNLFRCKQCLTDEAPYKVVAQVASWPNVLVVEKRKKS